MINPEHSHMELRAFTFSHFLKTYNIETEDRAIFHIGCATGALSAELAEKASRVHGFDQREYLINFAKNEYLNLKNIGFEYCPSLIFNFPRICNLALIDFATIDCYDTTNEHKKELFECINQHLSHNGEMFISITTTDNVLHPNIITAVNMAPTIQEIVPDITEENIIELATPPYPSLQELLTMLEETGFEVMTSEEQTITTEISTDNLYDIYADIVTKNPLFECVQDPDSKIMLGVQFIQKYIDVLEMNNEGNLLEPTITTIIHARKIKNIS